MSAPQLLMLVPTRVRPHAVAPLAAAFAATCTAHTWLAFCVDGDDDPAYPRAQQAALAVYPRTLMISGPRRRLVATLNHYAAYYARVERPAAIGYLGDDHRPETFGWDTFFLDTLAERPGIVYGDDGLQHENLPTACAVTAELVAALGHMAPPALTHMYCDTYWRDLGRAAGCLTYLPDVRITHLHPATGLTEWDASYRESNSSDQYAADEAAYRDYVDRGALAADVEKVHNLR